METPNYIKNLVSRNGKPANSRKVWSIDLESVWLPFFTATNTMGDTAIPHDALGAPLRLAYNPDGSVRFSKAGNPVVRVAKDLADNIRLVRDNFTAGLMSYSNGVATENPEAYGNEAVKAREAGQPIIAKDSHNLSEAIAKQVEAEVVKAEAKPKGKRERTPEAEKELVST